MTAAHPPFFANADLMRLEPFEVDPDMEGRIGLFFPAKAEALGKLIKANGQNDPIKVSLNKPGSKFKWKLVSGLHRLQGCLNEGLDVWAIEVGAAYALDIQASENMDRRELEPLERAMFVHAVADAAKRRVLSEAGVKTLQALGGKAKASKAGLVQSKPADIADEEAEAARANLAQAYGWRDEVAEACGLCLSDLKRCLRIYRFVVEPNRDLMDAFKDHPVAKKASDLLEIASIKDGAKRRKVIDTLICGPGDLGYVLEMVGLKQRPASADSYTKFTGQIITGWSRLSTGERRTFIPDFVARIPAGMKAELLAELQKESGQ